MRVLVVDDEAPARQRLRRLLDELGIADAVDEASTGEQALHCCGENPPDVVLMDIRMPGMDGVEAARHLSILDEPPAVIFTTAYNEYALEAFDASAVGYLMKPIRRQRLEEALHRASRLTRPQLAALSAQPGPAAATRRTHICARSRGRLRVIPLETVLYFQADQKYVSVHHHGGEDLIDESLKSLEEEFSPQWFVRIHRKVLVSMRHLDAVERNEDGGYVAVLRDGSTRLDVSRRLAGSLRKRIESR